MSGWTCRTRAAALTRLANLVARGLPWSLGFDVLAEEFGARQLAAARHAVEEGHPPARVLVDAGLVTAEQGALLARSGAELATALGLLADSARDTAELYSATWNALAYPTIRLGCLCLVAAVIWGMTQVPVALVRPSGLAFGLVLILGLALGWLVPLLACCALWRLGILRAPLERLQRSAPLTGETLLLYTTATFWRTLGLGLSLNQSLPEALRGVRDAFARGSQSRREVESLLALALEGSDLPGVISYLENPALREETILRVAQERGSLTEDVLALAELKRQQALDSAHACGGVLLLAAETLFALATGTMLLLLLMGPLDVFTQLQF